MPQPIFSDEDADLRDVWWTQSRGYGVAWLGEKGSKKLIFAHRIVLERMLGRTLHPKEFCDHISGNGSDNRRNNLRPVNHKQNAENKHTYGEFRGVSWDKKKRKWLANVHTNRKTIYLGRFSCRYQAAAVAKAKRKELGFYDDNPQTAI